MTLNVVTIKNSFAAMIIALLLATLMTGCTEESAPDLMAEADIALASGNLPLAAERFGAILKMQPENGFVRWRLAKLLLSMELGKEAEQEIRAAADLSVGDERVRPALAQALFLQSNWQALANLSPDQLSNGSKATVLAFQALGEIENSRFDAAQKLIQQAKVGSPYATDVVYSEAMLAISKKEYQRALDSLRKVEEIDPEYRYTASRLGEVALELGDPLTAEKHFTRAIKRRFRSENDRFQRAIARYRQGEFTLAVADAMFLLKREPANADYLLLAFEASAANGEGPAAVNLLRQALSAPPASADDKQLVSLDVILRNADVVAKDIDDTQTMQLLRAQVHLRLDEKERARELLTDLLAKNPSNIEAIEALDQISASADQEVAVATRVDAALEEQPEDLKLLMMRADMASSANDWDGLVRFLQRAMEIAPEQHEARSRLARHYLVVDGNAEKALGLLDGVDVGTNPTDLATIGEANYQLDRTTAARLAYEKLVMLQSDSLHSWFRLSELYGLAGDAEAARNALEKVIEIAPEHDFSKIAQARLQIFDGSLNQAERTLSGLELSNDEPELVRTRMLAALSDKRFSEAQRLADQLQQSDDGITVATALSRAYQAHGRSGEAIKVLEEWRAKHGDHLRALIELAGLYAETGRDEQKREALSGILALQPENIFALNNLAGSLKSTDPARALQLAEQAQALAPDSSQVTDTLIAVLASNQRIDEALQYASNAVATAETPSPHLLRRAELLLMAGRTEEAVDDLKAINLSDIEIAQRERRQQLIYALQD